ncbi:MAG TPA: cytochrome c3 family protein [Gemmataceae bacterium]|nr:cytochrome c3 family protein [Gemmataceae bacterium]
MTARGKIVSAAALLLAALVVVLIVRSWQRQTIAPLSHLSSPYLNTGPGAHYIGSAACRSCHEEQTASFRRTGMGRSMTLVDPKQEPPDADFDHPTSKRRYQVRRKDGALWHRELLRTEQTPEEVLLSEYSLQYVVGSGRHARTYLVETDGFLVESPLTWYQSRLAWGMSPGYEGPKQQGFTRDIGERCLFCHSGRAEAIGRSLHRMHISEAAIGCERCHGPGSLHVQRHEDPRLDDKPAEEFDYTIVNPAHLSRDLAEAVCQQCHLDSAVMVTARGRKLADFRPGLRLQDFRHVYAFAGTDRSMAVVGHVEQMHLSRCYQGSETLSCLTCHDPHGEPAEEERTAYYKNICLSCHPPERCTVNAAQRRKESPNNDCVHCHMPRSPVDVPHLAFTHHRIGIHSKPPAGAPAVAQRSGALRPFLELPPLSDADRKWSLGEAYRLLSLEDADAKQHEEHSRRALDLLSAAHAAGLRDGELDAALAQLYFHMKVGDSLALAQSALSYPDLAGQSRCNVLFVLAQEQAKRRNYAESITALSELTQLRRHVFDWLYLANFRQVIGDEVASREALLTAIRIDPRQCDVHRYLAEQYRRQGDKERAAWHQQRAVP